MLHQLVKEDGLFVVKAILPSKQKTKDYEVKLVLDTGAVVTVIDTDVINLLGYSAREDGVRRSSLDGAGGRSVGYMAKMPSFKCLGFELKNFEIACHDMDTRLGVTGLLGMNFLSCFRMDINLQTGEIFQMEQVEP